MVKNYSTKDLQRPIFVIALYTIIAIGIIVFGAGVIVFDALINGFTPERIEQFYGRWLFFALLIGIGLIILWYIIHNIQVIIYRNQNNI